MFDVVVTRSRAEWGRTQPLDGQSPAARGDVLGMDDSEASVIAVVALSPSVGSAGPPAR